MSTESLEETLQATATAQAANGYPDLGLSHGVPDGEEVTPQLLARVARTRFRLLDRDALDHLPPPDPLVGGVLPRVGLAMLAGSRGLGKSLTALDWTGHVTTDLPAWCGRPVPTNSHGLYISLEGFHGIPERVRAWESHHDRRMSGVTWWPDPVDLRRHSDARYVGAIAAEIGAAIVVTDSARASGAGSEDTKDMGAFVAGLETIRSMFNGLLLVLHNTGWDGSRERGSTLLPDACDTTLILEGKTDGDRTLKHRKARDFDQLDVPLTFEFRKIAGTRSGILAPLLDDDPDSTTPTRDLVIRWVKIRPGSSTGDLAKYTGRSRESIRGALTTLRTQEVVANTGTTAKPSWILTEGQLL